MGSSVLEDPRQRPTAANESGDTPMDAALSQSPPEAAQAGLASRSVNRSQKHGYDRHHSQFDDLSWPQSRIAWQPLRVVKRGPCRLRNFESGLSAPASLRTGFHICSALSPTKALSGRAAIGPFRRTALRRLLS